MPLPLLLATFYVQLLREPQTLQWQDDEYKKKTGRKRGVQFEKEKIMLVVLSWSGGEEATL